MDEAVHFPALPAMAVLLQDLLQPRVVFEAMFFRQLEEVGIRSDTEVVTTCRSGIRAGHTFMILEALGLPGAATYVGSWRRWTV